jgi:hypothetical protein
LSMPARHPKPTADVTDAARNSLVDAHRTGNHVQVPPPTRPRIREPAL